MADEKKTKPGTDIPPERLRNQRIRQQDAYLFHIREVARQSVFAATAFHNMEKLLSAGAVLHNQAWQVHQKRDQKALSEILFRLREEGVLFWYHLQALLIASGNLSKLFWPSIRADNGRGVWLRSVFEVKEDSPLKNRDIRNHFEHFDERLDKWETAGLSAGFADELVVFPGQMDPASSGLPLRSCMRVFYVSDMSASFYGRRYHIQPVVDEVNRILPVAMAITDKVQNALHTISWPREERLEENPAGGRQPSRRVHARRT